jgi:NTE family protein
VSLAVVLGSGGLVGPAFHLATLHRLRAAGSFDPADVGLWVGTSGGSIVASLLAGGVPFDDLCTAFGVAAGPTPDPAIARAVDHLLSLPVLGWGSIQRPRRASRRLLPDWRQRIAVRASSLFGAGDIDPLDYAEPFRELIGSSWPATLRICAVRVNDGSRVVFGPDSALGPVEACAASCAVPGLFRPVAIEGVEYSDGGFYSPTNADVIIDSRSNRALVLSPMSSTVTAAPVSSDHPIRVALHGIVATERRNLRRHGIQATIIEPTRMTRKAIGARYLDRTRLPAIIATISP